MSDKEDKTRKLQLQGAVDQFNKSVKVGARVCVMKDDGTLWYTTIRHEATILGDHTAVAWLAGRSDCYLLSRVRKV